MPARSRIAPPPLQGLPGLQPEKGREPPTPGPCTPSLCLWCEPDRPAFRCSRWRCELPSRCASAIQRSHPTETYYPPNLGSPPPSDEALRRCTSRFADTCVHYLGPERQRPPKVLLEIGTGNRKAADCV